MSIDTFMVLFLAAMVPLAFWAGILSEQALNDAKERERKR